MGFPPGQRGSAKHAKGLVSVPWEPDSMEETGSKAGRQGNHNWHEGKLRVPGMRCQWAAGKGGKRRHRVCPLSLRVSKVVPSWGHPLSKALPERARALSLWQASKLSIKKEMPVCCTERKGCLSIRQDKTKQDGRSELADCLSTPERRFLGGQWNFFAPSGGCSPLIFST